jgi:hypothetical protein
MVAAVPQLKTVEDIVLNGVRLTDDFGGGLISCTFDASASQSTQIEFAYIDPDFIFTRSKAKFTIGDPASFLGYRFQVSRVAIAEEAGNPKVTVSLRSDLVRKLKELQGKKVMYDVSPSEFIASELKSIGATGVLQKSPRRNTVARDVKAKGENQGLDPESADNEMSAWTTFRRFAQETGYLLFEDSGTLYFGQPEWLTARDTTPLTVAYGQRAFDKATGRRTRPFDVPECSTSIDSKVSEVTAKVEPGLYKQVRIGQALKLAGVPGFAATYMIQSLSYDMMGTSSLNVTATTPINQEPEKGPFADGSRLV